MSVESAGKDQGATFRVFLDVLHQPVLTTAHKEPGRTTAPKSLRLLLVDDHADTRAVLSRLLNKSGHEVVTADSVEKALELLDSRQFDALISDIGLPISSGHDLVRETKRRQSLKAIALSGFGMDDDVQRSLDSRVRLSPDQADQFPGPAIGTWKNFSRRQQRRDQRTEDRGNRGRKAALTRDRRR